MWNHAFMATQDRHLLLDDVAGRRHCLMLTHPGEGARYMLATSPFHAISSGFSMVSAHLVFSYVYRMAFG